MLAMQELTVWWPLAVIVVDWVAVAKGWKRLEYVAKPAAMVALLAWFWLRVGPAAGIAIAFWTVGLALSLFGDVLLLLPPRFFTMGLVAFLLAHVAYILGFFAEPAFVLLGGVVDRAGYFPWRVPALPALAALAAPIIFVAAWLGRRVVGALANSGHSKLRAPVIAYTGVITAMVIAALTTLVRPDWPGKAAALVAIGAELFFVSDALLAWNRFVSPVRYGKLMVIVTYHLAQMAIIAGVALEVSRRMPV
jgi:uncharacterized membrane protein YhhN